MVELNLDDIKGTEEMVKIIEKLLFGKQSRQVINKDSEYTINSDNYFEDDNEINELIKENEYLNDIISGYEHIIETYIDEEKLNDIKDDILYNDDISNDEKILLLKLL